MQYDIAAIKDGFPEGVWLNAVFRFLLERGYLTVVFQDGDGFRSTEVQMSGIRFSVTITDAYWWRRPYQWLKFASETGLHCVQRQPKPWS